MVCFSVFCFFHGVLVLSQSIDVKDSIDHYKSKGQFSKALLFAEKKKSLIKAEKGNTSSEFGNSLNEIGDLMNRSGRSKEAEPILVQSLKILESTPGSAQEDLG